MVERESELERLIRIRSERGHATAFARETPDDLRNVEFSTAMEFATSLRAEFGIEFDDIRSNKDPNSPPDCFATHKGQTLKLELTELVDCELISRIKSGKR